MTSSLNDFSFIFLYPPTPLKKLKHFKEDINHTHSFLTWKSISKVNERENKWIKDKNDSGKEAKNTFFIALPISLFSHPRCYHNVVNFLFWCLSWCCQCEIFLMSFFTLTLDIERVWCWRILSVIFYIIFIPSHLHYVIHVYSRNSGRQQFLVNVW